MRRLRLGIDLDGVVADFNAGWMDRYNRHFSATLTPAQVVHWDGLVPITHFADMDEFWAWARGGPGQAPAGTDAVEAVEAASPSIFRDLPPYAGALDVLGQLASEHQVVIVSSKYDWAIADTLEWLAEHRVPTREIHFTWEKAAVPCDVYLEDAPHNLELLAAERPDAVVCRFVRPWNAPVEGTVDIHDWDQFAKVVAHHAVQRPVT